MIENPTPLQRVVREITNGHTDAVRLILLSHPELVELKLSFLLANAAQKNKPEIIDLLILEFGADVNKSSGNGRPEGPIDDAVMRGSMEAVRCLLKHDAKLNHTVDGMTRCFALTSAILDGNLELMKLLVEHGADYNAVWIDLSPLSYAIMYGKKEAEAYLRSIGAKEPKDLGFPGVPDLGGGRDSIAAHLEKTLGKPSPLSLREIVPGDPPIVIHAVRTRKFLALVTEGMSSRPMTVPPGAEAYQYAELVIYLPRNWPITDEALADPDNFWPIEWLRKIARYPHEAGTWLGSPSVIIANEEPPQPLVPGTKFTCMLLTTEVGDFDQLDLPDGRHIEIYSLFPLYTEERDLEKEQGMVPLIKLFQRYGVDTTVKMNRRNVAVKSARSWWNWW